MNIAPILKARFIVVALAGLLVSALLAGQASANEFRMGSPAPAATGTEFLKGVPIGMPIVCPHGGTIPHPGIQGWRGGYEVNVKNECSEYGTRLLPTLM